MRERDIRPEEMSEEVLRLFGLDVRDMVRNSGEFVHVKCPCCDEDGEYWDNKQGFIFRQCSHGMVFISPRPTVAMLSDYYTNARSMNYWNDVLFPATEKSRRKIFKDRAAKVLSLAKKYKSGLNTLVDVGAGYGTFCEEAKGFKKVIAVEANKALAESCRKKGIETINKPIEEVKLKANVVTSFEVIEHLFDPAAFVRACADAIDGLFILTTPNIEGFELSMLGKRSPNVGGPDHLNYFTPTTIRRLMENNGFEVLEVNTPGKLDVDIVNNHAPVEGFIGKLINTGDKFQKFLADNGLSSHMWAVGKK